MFKLCELGALQHPAGIDEVGDQIILGLISRPKLVHPPPVKRLQFLPALAGKNPAGRRPKSVLQGVQASLRLTLCRKARALSLAFRPLRSNLLICSHVVSSDKVWPLT